MNKKTKNKKCIYLIQSTLWEAYEGCEPKYYSHICYDMAYESIDMAKDAMINIYDNKYKHFEGAQIEIFKDKIRALWTHDDGKTPFRRMSHTIIPIALYRKIK